MQGAWRDAYFLAETPIRKLETRPRQEAEAENFRHKDRLSRNHYLGHSLTRYHRALSQRSNSAGFVGDTQRFN